MASTVIEYVAGALGGAAGLVVGHPFDTTKVQLQTKQMQSVYRNTWNAMEIIFRNNSLHGFYRGLGLPLASYGLVNSVFFGTFANTLQLLKGGQDRPITFLELSLAGGIAGMAQVFVSCPVEVAKVTLQSQLSQGKSQPGVYYRNSLHCLTQLARNHGIASCYRGFYVQIARDVPASCLYFTTYEKLNIFLIGAGITDSRHILANLLAGGWAGVMSWVFIIPLDVVKTLYQSDVKRYRSSWHCAQYLYQERGWRAFTVGSMAMAIRAFPVNAVTFAVYEQSLKLMKPLISSHLNS